MPNWVQTKLTFNGEPERVSELLETIKTEKDGDIRHFDFEKIIPMPQSMKITSGSSTDFGIDILKYRENGDDSALKSRLSWPWVVKAGIKTVEELVEHAIEGGLADLHEGKLALDNIKNYGCKDWYDWAVKNWGTKWNSSDGIYENGTLSFQTAWSLPEPVLVKLSEMFPDVTIGVVYADEDIGSNCGEFQLVDGNIENYIEYDGIQACEVWGYDPADYFPEVLRDRRIDEVLDNDDDTDL
jgi:hypothetical protein